MTQRRPWAAPMLAGLALTGLAACGPPPGAGPGPGETAAPTAAERETLRRASERLIARCMAAAGFAYTEQPPPVRDREFRYLLDDPAWARAHGYGRGGTVGADVNDAHLAALPPARRETWQRTLMGTGRELTAELPGAGRLSAPGNGCEAEARRTLYPDLPGWYRARRTVDHLDGYLAGRVTATPEYRAALTAWADCVRGRGYPEATPQRLRARAAAERRAEIAAAVTEAECAVATGFPGAVGALEARLRPEVERRFRTEIDTLHRYERTALPTAGHILADS